MLRRMAIWDVKSCFKPYYSINWHAHHMFEQGSPKWVEFRNAHGGIGASAAAAVLADAASSTVSRAQLRKKLRGEPSPEPSEYLKSIFKKGQDMEPILRDELSAALGVPIIETGVFVEPEIGTFRWQGVDRSVPLSSSLDGLAIDWRTNTACVVEFKYRMRPGAGWGPTRNNLGPTVWCQVQQQMRCSGCRFALIYVGSDPIMDGMPGDRNLWAVEYAPGYNNGMFPVYAKDFIRECSLPRIPRRESGLNAKVMLDLNTYMRNTVYKVDI